MAGFAQASPWSYGLYSTPGTFGFNPGVPGSAAWPQAYAAPLSLTPPQIQYLQQLLQIVPLQIQQLQQMVQFLPQQVAQIVAQTLIQGQTHMPIPGSFNVGSPFQPIPSAGGQFSVNQPGYVM